MFAIVLASGCSDESAGDSGITIATVTRTADSDSAGPVAASQTEAPSADNTPDLTGFIFPIDGACLPEGDQLMPNAPREYRLGIHEGIDFYEVDNCTAIGLGTQVVAAKAGRVIRIDHNYADLTSQTLAALLANPTTDASFDAFRGRQLWIDHGGGLVTRYCHLSGVAPELQVNDMVAQGQTIAFVGESGTPGSVNSPGTEFHLHWEVRIGDSYLGEGQEPAQVRALYLSLFEP
jgi:murein DD-endopeptidase MepM/ murein hydrolase activator NlpD